MVHSPRAPSAFAPSKSSAMDVVSSVLGPMTVGSSAVRKLGERDGVQE